MDFSKDLVRRFLQKSRISTENIDSICSLESRLPFGSICSIGILSIFKNIAKTSFPKIAKCSTLLFANPDLDISHCGLLVFDEFESAKSVEILERIEERCDESGADKPHILGLSTSILKTNCSADDLKGLWVDFVVCFYIWLCV